MEPRLSNRDLRRLPELLAKVHGATAFEDLLRVIFEVTAGAVSCDSANYNEVMAAVRPRSRRSDWEVQGIDEAYYEARGAGRRLRFFVAARPLRMDLDPQTVCAGFERHVLDHPVLVHNREHPALETYRLSELISDRQMIRTPLYNEFFRFFPVRKQLVTYLDFGPGRDVVLVLARGPGADFSDRDLALMRVMGPHLRQALVNVRAWMRGRRELEEARALIARHRLNYVRLDGGLRIAWMTPEAERCLAAFFPGGGSPMATPDAILAWLWRHPGFAPAAGIAEPRDARPLEQCNDTHRLLIRAVRTRDGGCLLVLHEEPIVLSPDGFAHPGLTAAENRVLFWIAQGRANPEIALLLGISGRTVNKHIQNLFQKMGVASRSEAMVAAGLGCQRPSGEWMLGSEPI